MKKYSFLAILAVIITGFAACKKENLFTDKDPVLPKENARWVTSNNVPVLSDSVKTYFIPSSNAPFKIPVGFTTVSDKDRVITFSYTSTDARAGVQYNAPATVTIPAGKAVDTLTINGLYSGFTSASQIDTLVIRITNATSAGASPQIMPTKVTVLLRQFCDEAAPVLSMSLGAYRNTTELFGTSAYGPYTTNITAVTPINATSAKIAITNIWDTGWGPIEFILNWANPGARTTTVVPNVAVPNSDGADLSSTYAGMKVAVRQHATNPTGTYSACNQTFRVFMQLGVSDAGTVLGYFSQVYRVDLAR